jgi:hypothetical protein
LRIDEAGNKSWIVRWSSGGKLKKFGLGPLRIVSLSQAHDKAAEVLGMIRNGTDPREDRQAKREAAAIAEARSVSFDDAAKQYIAARQAGWKNAKHATQWQATLSTYASPTIGRLPISAIDTRLVLKVIEPIWATKNETAHRVRGRIEQVLGWAKAHGYRHGDNPAEWATLKHLLAERGRVHRSSITPRCPMPSCRASCVTCASDMASAL